MRLQDKVVIVTGAALGAPVKNSFTAEDAEDTQRTRRRLFLCVLRESFASSAVNLSLL
jgi:hypothetical protein